MFPGGGIKIRPEPHGACHLAPMVTLGHEDQPTFERGNGAVAVRPRRVDARRGYGRLPGQAGPGQGKHIVFLAGDEEYRSEEGLPMLAKILAVRHGFKCTVVFPINPANGTIDPLTLTNMPGIAALDSADVCVMGLRFRELPDPQMKHFADYLNAGKPIIALRTSTHAFKYDHNKASPYAKYDWHSTIGPAASVSRCSGRRGWTTTAATAWRARAG